MQPECPHDHSVNIKDEKGTIVIPLLFVFRGSRKRRNLHIPGDLVTVHKWLKVIEEC